jgi:FKBP-type peptidyl-prolyl cis-trans isomerase
VGGSRGSTVAQPAHNRSEQDAAELRHVRRKKTHDGAKKRTTEEKNAMNSKKTAKKSKKTQKNAKKRINHLPTPKKRFYPYPSGTVTKVLL